MSTFSERLKQLRIQHNLSQEQFATQLGMARNSIFSYETGRRTPDITVLLRMATFFNVTADYLLGSSQNRTEKTAAIGDSLGLTDESITALKKAVELIRESYFTSNGSEPNGEHEQSKLYIETVNILLSNPKAVDAIGRYIMCVPHDGLSYKSVYSIDSENKSITELNDAINMYILQKELYQMATNLSNDQENPNAHKED